MADRSDAAIDRIRTVLNDELAARILDVVHQATANDEQVISALVSAIVIYASGNERTATEAEELMIDAAGALCFAATGTDGAR